ncbi:sigma-54-dependent transcriptional regulator [Sulfuricystis multivorans]|uniref:sigma-54-dependent transcriptional regulator n=1 Tax=Sulfuricystis multivorans TaxID=2211108 RepID=UPI000F8395F5|nr:sigma-54 dependent transcriptional regulator [Sulfuricystis multivorans]
MRCPPDRKPRLCLIEDDAIMGESLAQLFSLEGFDVSWYRTAAAARQALLAERYCVVVSDIRLPDMNGGDLFLELVTQQPALPPFLFMTAYGTIDRAVELLKAGAADYVTKPFDVDSLVQKVRGLAEIYGAGGEADDISLGVSAAMRRIAESLPRLARHASALMITGESGSGKEHVARLFHHHAVGSTGEFVAVNCASIPETLMEAELFGYEKGAFTGAMRAKRGLFEQADGGTLFLDEIGEMPLSMQAKLLRVIQDRRFVRLGAEKPLTSDFRLICATHRDLKAMVEEGKFREDLYYRIHVIHLRIPPLRERPDDIRWFVRHFIDEFNRQHPDERRRLDPRTEQALLSYSWPGNVRELKHAVERACILASGPVLGPEAFFDNGQDVGLAVQPVSASLADYLMACERDYLMLTLERHGGHMTRAAEALGITRKTLWEKLRRLGVSKGDEQITG